MMGRYVIVALKIAGFYCLFTDVNYFVVCSKGGDDDDDDDEDAGEGEGDEVRNACLCDAAVK